MAVILIISIHAKYPFGLWIPAPHIFPSLQARYANRNEICSVPSSSRRPDLADRNSRTLSLISKRTFAPSAHPKSPRQEVQISPGLRCTFAVNCAFTQCEVCRIVESSKPRFATNACGRCTLPQRARRKKKKKKRYKAD